MSLERLPLRTPTLPPATHTNCWRLGDCVIDPASPYVEEQARLAEWAVGIRRILLTHAHHDHIGGVESLRAHTGAEVWAHADAPLPFPVDHHLVDGERIDTGRGVLVALHTPGHADGHLAFQLEGSGDVVCGDLVAGEGTIVLLPPEGHLATYLHSLARVAGLAERLLPAHGAPVPASTALDYITHRNARTRQVQAALAAGHATPEAIAAEVYRGVPGVNLQLAAAQVRTHLGFLVETGQALERAGRWSPQ